MPLIGGGGVNYVAAGGGAGPASYIGEVFNAGASGASGGGTIAAIDNSTTRKVLVGVYVSGLNKSPWVSAVTVGGVSATQRGTHSRYSITAEFTWWEVTVSSGNTGVITATAGGTGMDRFGAVAFDVTGMSYVSDDTDGSDAGNSPWTLTVAGTAGQSVMAGAFSFSRAITWTSGATAVGTQHTFSDGDYRLGWALNTSAGASQDVVVTMAANPAYGGANVIRYG